MVESFDNLLAFLGLPGHSEWIILLVIALLIFGKRLPDVAKNLGKSLTSFKKGIQEGKEASEEASKEIDEIKSDVTKEAKEAVVLDDSEESKD